MCDRGAPKVRWMQSRDDDMSSREERRADGIVRRRGNIIKKKCDNCRLTRKGGVRRSSCGQEGVFVNAGVHCTLLMLGSDCVSKVGYAGGLGKVEKG